MTAITVQLAEWQTVSPSPGSPTENVNLGSDPSVLDLARRLTETGILEAALSTCKNGRFSEVFCNLAPSSVVLGHGFSQKARVFDGFPC